MFFVARLGNDVLHLHFETVESAHDTRLHFADSDNHGVKRFYPHALQRRFVRRVGNQRMHGVIGNGEGTLFRNVYSHHVATVGIKISGHLGAETSETDNGDLLFGFIFKSSVHTITSLNADLRLFVFDFCQLRRRRGKTHAKSQHSYSAHVHRQNNNHLACNAQRTRDAG